MFRWPLAVLLSLGVTSAALAQQTGGEVNGGLNSNGGAMYGATINRVLGILPNGVPRQQMPGASMTNGAGNSTMTPGIAGVPPPPPSSNVPPHGYAIPTINGQPSTSQ